MFLLEKVLGTRVKDFGQEAPLPSDEEVYLLEFWCAVLLRR